jgi:hypothetical protein
MGKQRVLRRYISHAWVSVGFDYDTGLVVKGDDADNCPCRLSKQQSRVPFGRVLMAKKHTGFQRKLVCLHSLLRYYTAF